ncbi:MAG: putative serine/threonine protein [Planctomycetota bacterium]|nr:MAG: putative serine/threonine protein [Planctomycetota bacterium]
MPKLLVEKGPNKGQSLVLSGAGPFHIGREPVCSFVLNDTNVSRKHCEIVAKSGSWSVRDLGSRNGTYLNGRKLSTDSVLQIGDRLQTGEILISFLDEKEGKDKGGLIGTRVGGYRIMERLGRGGMGTVYKANQIALNREIALKVLSPDLIQEDVFKNLFIAEARAAAALNHPNIVQIHDVGVEAGLHYFSMELMPNGSVHELLIREGRLPASRALRIAMDAASGLGYAERKGIVHRDIKPENLMIGETGVVKIGDLGLAFHVGQAEVEDEVGVMGTPHFCAPEQVTRGKLDHRTDLYALGASMYRMLAGKPPFVGQTLKEILVKKVKERPVPLTEAVKGLPPAVSDLVMQLLERNPADRPQSAEEVKGRIEAILPEIEGHGLAGSGNTTRRDGGGPAYGSSAALKAMGSSGPTTVTPAAASRPAATVTWLAAATLLLAAAVSLFGYQYFNKKGSGGENSSGVKPGPVGDKPIGYIPTEQDLANEKQVEIAKWIGETRPQTVTKEWANLAAARYENLVEKYPKTPAAASARLEIDKLRTLIREIAAQDAYNSAQTFEGDCSVKFNDTMVSSELLPAAERYEEVAKDYSGTEAAVDAGLAAKRVRGVLAKSDEARGEWEKIRAIAEDHLTAGRFKDARIEIEVFRKKFDDTCYDPLARAEAGRITSAAREHFDRVASPRLNGLMEAKDWDGAKKAVAELKGRYGIDTIERSLADTEKEITERSTMVKPPDTVKTDEEIEAEALGTVADMEAAWKFAEAALICREAAAKVKAGDSQARLTAAAEDADMQEIVRRALKSHANGNDKDDSGLRSRSFRGSTILASSETGLKLDNGQEVAWGKISAAEAFKLAFNGWPVSGREALGIALMCMRASGWRSARLACALAGQTATLSGVAKALADRSDREERSRIPINPKAADLFGIEKAERLAANDAMDRIVKPMNKAKEMQGIGEVYSGMQMYAQSDELLKQVLDGRIDDAEEEWRAELFLALNAGMQANEGEYRAHAFKARNIKPDESHSRWVKQADEMWKGLVDNVARVDELRILIYARPDPARIGELLRLYEQKLHMLVDQRAVARWLTETDEWSRDPYVKTGEPQRILADTCAGMKDFFVALKMYERLRARYSSHEWCRTPENGTRRVDLEVISCREKVKKWGLGR